MWGGFWQIVFLICLLLFASMAAVVIVAGFRDVRVMFRRLKARNRPTNSDGDE